MSGLNVCVLAPNGRRNNIKCTPNSTLLQILEEACKKQNLKPEDYDLKHHNKVLDTTTTFRFSGLPNNAQLELVNATKLRADADVTLALNLENGDRLVGTFSPNVTLLTILENLCPDSASEDKNPVVIYTRREIYGTELESVTLKSLGITGGRAMVRLIHRSPEELKVQANVAVPLPSRPVEEKPYVRKLQLFHDSESSQKLTVKEQIEKSQIVPNTDEDKDKKPKAFPKSGTVDILKLAKEKRKSSGFLLGNKEKKASLNDEIENSKNIPKPANCECETDKPMEIDCSKKCEESCTNLIQENIKDEFIFLGERNAMLFSLETAKAIPSEDLPDDFFDLTINDAKKLLRDVRRQRHYMEHAPLTTSEGKNLEESKKQLRQLNRYKKAIIRIQFPDRTVLQGTFAPTDTIKSVTEFVREYLEDKSMKFYVYTTPPKEILEENKNLIELGFLPGALIHFGTDISLSTFLRKELQNKFTSNSVASLAAFQIRKASTRKCDEQPNEDMDFEIDDEPSVNAGASTSTGITHENYEERKVVISEQKVPKWFKQ